MKVGLVDVDGHNFPNLALMKLSAWHKTRGDEVEFAMPLFQYDRIYKSKVFTFTPDDHTSWQCCDIRKGGTGYSLFFTLSDDCEHIMPDYSLYGITDTAYGFLSRGCPRGCPFCIVADKEGRVSRKVADLREWWDGQKNIVLMDPNILACQDWRDLLGQLAESGSYIDINQGADIRLLTPDKADALSRLKMKRIHFAWDGTDDLEPMFRSATEAFGKIIRTHRASVYVLTNCGTTMDWNLHRIYVLRDLGYDPYVMVYDKEHAPSEIRRLQRWCNNKFIFKKVRRFEDCK
mgnify:CR=1 FL=1